MDERMTQVLIRIGERYAHKIRKDGRHYIQVSIAEQARKMGFDDLTERYRHAHAVVPLKAPEPGMKVRIDGRTFLGYAQLPPGIAVPGYVARETSLAVTPFEALDSMICNYT